MKFIGTRLEVLVSILFLCIAESIFWPPLPYFTQHSLAFDASDPVNATAHAALLGFLVIVCVTRRGEMLAGLRAAWPVLLLVALAFLSAFWSEAPELVLRRSATLAITTLFAVYLAVRFEMGDFVALLVKVNAFAIVASLVVLAVAPRLAVDYSVEYEYQNAIRGVYASKNTLGGLSALGIAVAYYAWRRGSGPRLLAAAAIPGNLVLLVLSQSATARVLIVVITYVAVTAGAFRRRDAPGFVLGFFLVVFGIAALGMLAIVWTDLLAALHRSASLTGRLPIWRLAIHFIEERPWLGYGYGALWRHDGVEANTFWGALHWPVPHAHNGWLEAGLALGGLGMAGVTLLWLAAFQRAARLLAVPAARHVVFCLALLAGILLENLTEYEFLRADSFYWVFFVTAFTYLGLEIAAYRLEAPVERSRPPPLRAAAIAMPPAAGQ